MEGKGLVIPYEEVHELLLEFLDVGEVVLGVLHQKTGIVHLLLALLVQGPEPLKVAALFFALELFLDLLVSRLALQELALVAT